MAQIMCVRHGVPHIEAGGCLVCEAEAAQRRVASANKACAHAYRTMNHNGTWSCDTCGRDLDCEHRTILELGPAQLITDRLVPDVLLMLRQCADCRLIGVVGDAGKTVWMVRKG